MACALVRTIPCQLPVGPSLYKPLPKSSIRVQRRGSVLAMALEKISVKGTEKSKEPEFPAYVVGKQGAPAVVVLQEWWGVDYEIKNHAKTLADKGYRCLIPDLYRGKLGLDMEEAHHLMDNLDFPNALQDVTGAARFLKAEGSQKVGVVGFCMGGALALASACNVAEVDAAAFFYGIPPPQLADPSKCSKPVQGHFGKLDSMQGFSDPPSAEALEAKLKQSPAAAESTIFMYDGQGHAFVNASEEAIKRKKSMGLPDHDPKAVEVAWSRVDEFFSKHLK